MEQNGIGQAGTAFIGYEGLSTFPGDSRGRLGPGGLRVQAEDARAEDAGARLIHIRFTGIEPKSGSLRWQRTPLLYGPLP